MLSKCKDKLRLFFIAAYILYALGAVVGSLYYVNCTESAGDIKNSLDLYLQSIGNGLDLKKFILNTLKDNAAVTAFLAVGVFFKLGVALSGFVIIRKGFVIGFTTAAIIGGYGIKSIYIALISGLQYIITIPLTLFFCSVNALFSLRIIPPERKNIIFYILFLIIVMSIFSIQSVLEGFYITTFMKQLLSSVT